MFDDSRKREILEPNKSGRGWRGKGDVRYFQIWDQDISGMRVEVGGREIADSLRERRLNDCIMRLRGPLGRTTIYLDECAFHDCLLWPERRISLATWKADFIGCKFKGRWSARIDGRFENCDLSETKIEHFGLMQSTGPGCQWPPFPHVIVRDIAKHHADWNSTPVIKEHRITYGPAHMQPKTLVFNLQEAFDDPDLAWQQLSNKPWASRVD